VAFPAKPEVSEECRILILKILAKSSERVPLGNIRYDPWYKKHLPKGATDDNQADAVHTSKGLQQLVTKPLPTIESSAQELPHPGICSNG